MASVADLAQSENARKLILGLEERGYELLMADNYYVFQHQGAAQRNKASGMDAPTWELRADGGFYMDRVVVTGRRPRVQSDLGRSFTGVGSHMPLGWVVRQPVDQWEFDVDLDDMLRVTVSELPPNWQ